MASPELNLKEDRNLRDAVSEAFDLQNPQPDVTDIQVKHLFRDPAVTDIEQARKDRMVRKTELMRCLGRDIMGDRAIDPDQYVREFLNPPTEEQSQ